MGTLLGPFGQSRTFQVTKEAMIAAGSTLMAFASHYFNSVSLVYAPRDNPEKLAGIRSDTSDYVFARLDVQYWLTQTPNYAVPGSGIVGGVDIVPGNGVWFVYVARGSHVYELDVLQNFLDGSYSAYYGQPVSYITGAVPTWNTHSCDIAPDLINVEIIAIKFDRISGLLFCLFTYSDAGSGETQPSKTGCVGISVLNPAASGINPAGLHNVVNAAGFNGTTVGKIEYRRLEMPKFDNGAPGNNLGTTLAGRQKPNGYFVYPNRVSTDFDDGGWCAVSMADGSFEMLAEGGVTKISSINSPPYEVTPGNFPRYAYVDADAYTALSFNGGAYGYGPVKFKFGLSQDSSRVPLVSFLVWLCKQAGYTDAEISLTGLDDVLIHGASLTDDTDLESILNGLSQVYVFDYYNAGDYIKIIARNESTSTITPVASFTDNDLIPLDESKTILTKRLPPELFASTVTISYIDWDQDFAQASQTAKRTVFPIVTAPTNAAEININVPIVMVGTEAATAALRALFASTAQNVTNEFLLPWIGIPLEPTDIVKLTLGNYVYYVKLNEATTNGNLSVSCAGTNFAAKFTAAVDVQSVTTVPVTAPVVTRSRVLMFDTPAFVGGETRANAVAYILTIPRSVGTWNGAVEYKSVDDEAPSVLRSVSDVLPHMTVSSVPSDITIVTATDRDNVLTVTRIAGSVPTACTEDQARGGRNYAIYGMTGRWEFICFADVASLGNSAYQLSTLFRGLNGTEMHVNSHAPGDILILMSEMYADPVVYEVDQIGSSLVAIAANTYAATKADTDQNTIVLTGATLKPFAPVNPSCALSGSDVAIAWLRRDRAYSDITDGTGVTPMSEYDERYDLEIFDTDDALVRTVTDLRSPAYTYLAADMTADGINIADGLHVRIYQKSITVGRGFPCDKVIHAY
jgi:Putative phage tail protein